MFLRLFPYYRQLSIQCIRTDNQANDTHIEALQIVSNAGKQPKFDSFRQWLFRAPHLPALSDVCTNRKSADVFFANCLK